MKKVILLLLLIGLESCSSQKKIETSNQYFETGKSTIQQSVGGRAESGTNYKLKITLSGSQEGISFEDIYFRGQKLSCELKNEAEVFSLLSEYDSKSIEAIRKSKKKFPFELLPTEAIISYKKDSGSIKYLKITEIKEKAPIIFSSKPRN